MSEQRDQSKASPSVIGKTIARIEEGPTDREHGYQREDTLLVVFTDGTALEVVGSSYEEVSLGWTERSPEEVNAYRRAAAGRREQERVKRLEAQAWRAMSCDERVAHGMKRKHPMEEAMWLEMMRDANRSLFGEHDPDKTIKGFCSRCGAQYCENAPDIPVYGDRSGGVFYKAGEITIPHLTSREQDDA